MRVLICGATGYLGKHLVLEAKARGHWVRALARAPSRLGDARGSCDDVFQGEATQNETLTGLCDGADVVISSLGNRTLKRKPDCFDVDFRANMNIVGRAQAAGVRQFVFVSVLHGDRARSQVPQIEARERVVDALTAGSMPFTIIRPSGFFNDMSEILEMARKGTVWLPGDGGTLFNPIHGADLARVCLDCVGDDTKLGRAIDAGGPDALTMRRVAEIAFELLGKPPKIRSFPPWLLTAAASVIEPFNVNVASLIAMFGVFIHEDAVCDRYGDHHLRDFYAERLASIESGTLAVRS